MIRSTCLLLTLAVGSTCALAQASRPAKPVVTLIAAGDVEWSVRDINEPEAARIVYDNGGRNLNEGGWFPIPRLLTSNDMAKRRAANDPLMKRVDSADLADAIASE